MLIVTTLAYVPFSDFRDKFRRVDMCQCPTPRYVLVESVLYMAECIILLVFFSLLTYCTDCKEEERRLFLFLDMPHICNIDRGAAKYFRLNDGEEGTSLRLQFPFSYDTGGIEFLPHLNSNKTLGFTTLGCRTSLWMFLPLTICVGKTHFIICWK